MIIGAIPFFFFLLAMIIYPFRLSFSNYLGASRLEDKIKIIELSSAVVHEIQKERGASAGYINGGIQLDILNKQRELATSKIKTFTDKLNKSTFEGKYVNEILSNLSQVDALRQKVSSKDITLKVLLNEYSAIIKKLLQIEVDVAHWTDINEVSALLKTLRILEDSKESGGKFRAGLTGVFSKNEAIEKEKLISLIGLKSGLEEGMGSSALKLDEKAISSLSKILSSTEWNKVNDSFFILLQKFSVGQYNLDAKEFFDTISITLNSLNDLLGYEKNYLSDKVLEVKNLAFAELFFLIILIVILVSGLFIFVKKTAENINSKINQVIQNLNSSSTDIYNSSLEVEESSQKLSVASTQQASSIQETVTSVDEINHMVQLNSQSAKSSATTSELSQKKAILGKDNVDQMIKSIREISVSNEMIMSEIDVNNNEIAKITEVIKEIKDKTNVINDIVFQTKLLSFNASVEAARAGEHGKGFAVVAEEVGNLASMSGKAALEISDMLEDSIKQVESILLKSKGKIESLVSIGKEKVSHGATVAENCGVTLNELLENVQYVNSSVKEISIASQEQSTGISEVNKAMQQLDQVTHENSDIAHNSSALATQLKENAKNLKATVSDLVSIIEGQENRKAS